MKNILLIITFFTAACLNAQDKILESFEGPGVWTASVLTGNPKGLQVQTALKSGKPDLLKDEKTALGLKITCLIPGEYSILISPPRPLILPKGAKRVSLWFQAENRDHQLWIRFMDSKGKKDDSFMSKTNWIGWRQDSALVPAGYPEDSITISGFIINLDPLDLGPDPQYLYFDHLTAGGDWR